MDHQVTCCSIMRLQANLSQCKHEREDTQTKMATVLLSHGNRIGGPPGRNITRHETAPAQKIGFQVKKQTVPTLFRINARETSAEPLKLLPLSLITPRTS